MSLFRKFHSQSIQVFRNQPVVQELEPQLPNALYDCVTTETGRKYFKLSKNNFTKSAQDQEDLRNLHWKSEIGQAVLVCKHQLSKVIDQFAAKLAPKY